MEENTLVVSDRTWLPDELLNLIVDRIVEFPDFIRFSSVCRQWRLVARDHDQTLQSHRHPRFMPMVMTTTSPNNNKRSLYSITERVVYDIQMPLLCDKRFCGSCRGWLFMLGDNSINIKAFNPFLNKTLVLPNFPWVKGDAYFPKKAILTPQSTEESFEVLMIYGGERKLAYLKSQDSAWVPDIFSAQQSVFVKCLSDIISYKGFFYGVSRYSALLCVDVMKGRYQIVIGATKVFAQTTYLVESQDGDLLLIRRFVDDPNDDYMHKTRDFEVYKFSSGEEQADGNPNWVRVERIGEQALFLGENYSMSISTQDFPQCKSNCIYYVDDNTAGYKYVPRVDDDSGIYNMEDKSFSRHYIQDPSFCATLPPIWIVPTLS